MGSGQSKKKKKEVLAKQSAISSSLQDDQNGNSKYDEDVIDAANLAIAIQNEDFTTNIELFLHCENLPKMDLMSLSDPIIIVYLEKDYERDRDKNNDKEPEWLELGRTEIISENLNPKFVKTFIVSYNNEKKSDQRLKFEIYDIDDYDNDDNMDKQQLIGTVECTIREIVCSNTQTVSHAIKNKNSTRKRNGILHIRGSEYDIAANKILFRISCSQFASKGEIKLRINFLSETKDWMPIFETEKERNNKKQMVQWKDFQLMSSKYGNDENALLKLEVLEHSQSKGDTLLGETEITLSGMIENSGKYLRMMKNGLITGQIKLIEIKQNNRFSFLNYIYAGAKIQLIVAIDFTNSNKKEDGSLHKFDKDSQYIKSIEETLGLLQYYNSENRFLLYGFGAKLPPYHNIVSHCFSCTGNIFDPYVQGGIKEVIEEYIQTLNAVKLHGPTIFSQIIRNATQFAQSEKTDQQNQKYYILVIFTDGSINDLDATIDEIYNAQNVPLSIIIIGVGLEDFRQMQQLDADDRKLFSKKYQKEVERDIVQFVEINKYIHDKSKLAKEILAELPKQFLYYMETNKIEPIKSKKNTKAAAAANEYIHQKIEENRKLKNKQLVISNKVPNFLKQKKEEFIRQLIKLGYNQEIVENIINDGIPAIDVNLIIELIRWHQSTENIPFQQKQKQGSLNKIVHKINNRNDIPQEILNQLKEEPNQGHRIFRIQQKNKLDELLQMKKQESHLITKQFLAELQKNQVNFSDENKPKNDDDDDNSQQWNNKQKMKRNAREEAKSQEKRQHYKEQQQHYRTALQSAELKEFRLAEHLCLECRQNGIELVYIPCGHACSCYDCYQEQDLHLCQSCNQKVISFAQIQKNQ